MKKEFLREKMKGHLTWCREEWELARSGGGGSRQVWADMPSIEQRPRGETLRGTSLRSKVVLSCWSLKQAEDKEFTYCYILIC